MAGELAILKGLLDLVGAERVLTAAKSAWEKSKWARDLTKVNAVERKIDTLTHETARLARNLAPDAVKGETDRLIVRFEKELEELGLTKDEAADLRKSVATQLETSVLEPIAEARRLGARLDALEKENTEAGKRLGALEVLAARAAEAEKRAAAAATLAAVALGASGVALIATLLLAIIRR